MAPTSTHNHPFDFINIDSVRAEIPTLSITGKININYLKTFVQAYEQKLQDDGLAIEPYLQQFIDMLKMKITSINDDPRFSTYEQID